MPRSAIGVLLLFLLALPGPGAAVDLSLLRPPATPTVVSVGFVLVDLNEINERKETFEFETLVTLRWHDPRQAFDPSEAGVHEKYYEGAFHVAESYVGWWPQLGLENSAGTFERHGELLRIQPDGSMRYVYMLHATAEWPLELKAFPFDDQQLAVYMQVLGHNSEQIVLRELPAASGVVNQLMNIAGWKVEGISTTIEESDILHGYRVSQLVARIGLERRPFHLLALVVIPLTLLVMLTWSVFWMDEESLSDRINISFIGILSVVAYQFIIQDAMPAISYFTLMDAFLISTLVIVGLGVVVNLIVDKLNRADRRALGDRVDYTCRWAFPLAFVSVNAVCALLLT
ncbi:MAG: hypothetical protein VX614_01215 [Myxococcota bacterium]|nr:hypothetical protein [Myxococcota bacterium]